MYGMVREMGWGNIAHCTVYKGRKRRFDATFAKSLVRFMFVACISLCDDVVQQRDSLVANYGDGLQFRVPTVHVGERNGKAAVWARKLTTTIADDTTA